jgi:hypothetical protein
MLGDLGAWATKGLVSMHACSFYLCLTPMV